MLRHHFRITLDTFAYAGTLAFRPLPGGPKIGRAPWRLLSVENDFKMVDVVGFEPTFLLGDGVTARYDTPASSNIHIVFVSSATTLLAPFNRLHKSGR